MSGRPKMEAYDEGKIRSAQVVVEEEEKVVANAYPGERTDGTMNTKTRVKST